MIVSRNGKGVGSDVWRRGCPSRWEGVEGEERVPFQMGGVEGEEGVPFCDGRGLKGRRGFDLAARTANAEPDVLCTLDGSCTVPK